MRRSRLRKERKKRGLTHQEVADKVGIGKSHYTLIELGARNPRWEIGCRIGELFETDACKLLKRDGDDKQ